MKKVFTFMVAFIVSVVLFGSVSEAKGNVSEHQQVTVKIEKVYYMSGSGYYVAHTSRDAEGRFWALQVTDIAMSKEDKALTNALIKQYKGKQAVITFVEPSEEDEETEIVAVKLK